MSSRCQGMCQVDTKKSSAENGDRLREKRRTDEPTRRESQRVVGVAAIGSKGRWMEASMEAWKD